MKKLFSIALAAAAMLGISSCGSIDPLTSDNFTCTPDPLVEIGGKVDATINVTYPVKYFNQKATLTITPVLVYAGGETASEAINFQGEKVVGNDEEISYKYGGNATFKAHFDYIPAMAKSELYIDYKGMLKGKEYTFERIKIADGVVSTESLATAESAAPAYAKDNFVKDTFDKYIATLIYQYNSTNLRGTETKKDEVKSLQEVINATKDEERRELDGIDMVSTASPEGAVSLNEKLAAGREKSSKDYLQKFLKKAKVAGEITPSQIAEDWEGFKTLVAASSIQDKQLVLNVLGRISDPDAREREIKNLSAAYKELADEILPQLRYSKLTATVKNIGNTNEEILDLVKNNPEALTLEELLYAVTLQNADADKLSTLRIATNRFPEDVRALNNTATIYWKQGKYAEAEAAWKQVVAKDANNAQANMNLGLVALKNNDLAAAESYLGKAGVCPEYGQAMGTLLTKQGKYAQAIDYFGSAACNNKAVAQICAGKYNDAQTTLKAVAEKDAMTSYLLAVVAARTNNAAAVASNLKEAVKQDASLKAKAQDDVEFAKFAEAVAAL